MLSTESTRAREDESYRLLSDCFCPNGFEYEHESKPTTYLVFPTAFKVHAGDPLSRFRSGPKTIYGAEKRGCDGEEEEEDSPQHVYV
jgi:hypothetical protein